MSSNNSNHRPMCARSSRAFSVDDHGGGGPMAHYPLVTVILSAIIGVGIGLGLSFWDDTEDSNNNNKSTAIQWIGLIGDLFIRSLKCAVLPLVFINVIISIVDMMSIGAAKSIGWKTIGLYFTTTVIASLIGIISILSFLPLFKTGENLDDTSGPAKIMIGCTGETGHVGYMTERSDGTIVCQEGKGGNSTFVLEDLTGTIIHEEKSSINDSITMSDTIYDGIFTKLFTDNITYSFVDMNFAAVVFCAIVFGVAFSKVIQQQRPGVASNLLPLLKELDKCLLTIINWIIMVTPLAVMSLIASAVGSQDDLINAFTNVGYLVCACLFGFALHVIVVHWGLLFFITRRNPFSYLKHIIPAQTMAFACASSAATIPMVRMVLALLLRLLQSF